MKISIFNWKLSHLVWPNPSQTAMAAFLAAFILLFPFSGAMAEVSLLIDDTGLLTGATGVVVGDDTFDVSFVEGPCLDIFPKCEDTGNFTFTTFESAKLAATALEATVFLDSKRGNFDSIPSNVRGCNSPINACSIMTPFGFSAATPGEISDVSFINAPQSTRPGNNIGATDFVAKGRTKDKKAKPVIGVWAVWSSKP